MDAGGIFGSINHDTYDPHESVAYAVAFRTLMLVSRVLEDDAIRQFAFEKRLEDLNQFKMAEDCNGVATRGLPDMEKSWDTAYLWENAEAALAMFEAATELRKTDSEKKPPGRKGWAYHFTCHFEASLWSAWLPYRRRRLEQSCRPAASY